MSMFIIFLQVFESKKRIVFFYGSKQKILKGVFMLSRSEVFKLQNAFKNSSIIIKLFMYFGIIVCVKKIDCIRENIERTQKYTTEL